MYTPFCYRMSCGCKFKAYSENVKDCDGLPPITIDYYNLPYCAKPWYDVGEGKVKGIFQVEKHLGKKWCSEIKPLNIEELSAILSIMRPGVLEAIVDGKSLTKKFADRKNGIEEPIPLHPMLGTVLEKTQNILIYQEQVILIAKYIAGFTGVQADTLRRGIGHKDPKVVGEMEEQFVQGCMATSNMTEKDARFIFDIIRKGQRYLFNASHALAYAQIGEWTAYTKWHFPLHFFTSYLAYAKEKIDPKQETRELVNDAKQYGISIASPRLEYVKDDPEGEMIMREQEILFGMINVKGIGRNHIMKLYDDLNKKEKIIQKSVDKWNWQDTLVNLETNSTVMENLILIGAMPGEESRKRKSYEYSVWSKLTERDYTWIRQNYTKYKTFGETLANYAEIERSNGGPATAKKRQQLAELAQSLISPPFDVSDHPDWVVSNEKELLGIPLSYNPTETKSVVTNMTIADFVNGKRGKVALIVQITNPREMTVKNGPNKGNKMCYMTLEDSTGSMDCCVFSNIYEEVSEFIFDGNVVLVSGERSKKDNKSLFIQSMEQV